MLAEQLWPILAKVGIPSRRHFTRVLAPTIIFTATDILVYKNNNNSNSNNNNNNNNSNMSTTLQQRQQQEQQAPKMGDKIIPRN